MTERAQIVYYSARVVARSRAGRKPPNKVRTGGEDGGDGGIKQADLTRLNSDFAADILQKCLLEDPHFLAFFGIYMVIAWYLHG